MWAHYLQPILALPQLYDGPIFKLLGFRRGWTGGSRTTDSSSKLGDAETVIPQENSLCRKILCQLQCHHSQSTVTFFEIISLPLNASF